MALDLLVTCFAAAFTFVAMVAGLWVLGRGCWAVGADMCGCGFWVLGVGAHARKASAFHRVHGGFRRRWCLSLSLSLLCPSRCAAGIFGVSTGCHYLLLPVAASCCVARLMSSCSVCSMDLA